MKTIWIEDNDGWHIDLPGGVRIGKGARMLARHVAISYWLVRFGVGARWHRIYNLFSVLYCG